LKGDEDTGKRQLLMLFKVNKCYQKKREDKPFREKVERR